MADNFARPLAPALAVTASLVLSACVARTPSMPAPGSVPAAAPPPMTAPVAVPSSTGFIAPRVMRRDGLEDIIGQNGTAIANIFGPPRLEVREGDALKLQFTGEACVLDVYLYPLRPDAEPSATYLEARRASDGRDVERVACANALRRVPRR